jgi:hypothetical protein
MHKALEQGFTLHQKITVHFKISLCHILSPVGDKTLKTLGPEMSLK